MNWFALAKELYTERTGAVRQTTFKVSPAPFFLSLHLRYEKPYAALDRQLGSCNNYGSPKIVLERPDLVSNSATNVRGRCKHRHSLDLVDD
jgi:hypothetical protein